MSVAVSYPGVYVEEDASVALSIAQSATAVPVFVGQFTAADGSAFPASTCIRINSWLDFSTRFSFAYSVVAAITSALDDNTPPEWKYTDPVVSYTYNPAWGLRHYFENGGGSCYVLPLVNPADTAELAALPDAIEKEGVITLLVCLSDDDTQRKSVYNALNTLLQNKVDYFLIADSKDGSTASNPSTLAEQTAVYYPSLKTAYSVARPDDSAIVVKGYEDDENQGKDLSLSDLKTASQAEYQAVSDAIDAYIASNPTLTLPSSGTMAAVYCQNDARRGVWKAPANEAISGVTGLTALVTDSQQGPLNDAGVNVIRSFSERGIVVWGARTLAGTAANSDMSWRYVSVRRLFNSAERDIRNAMNTMVFQPNNQPTWERVRGAINNYLWQLWRDGALKGTTEKEAYFVQIGENITMTADDIAQGKMIAKVGMAAVRPAEYIILEFTQNMA
ncbi:phage tail sheath subtilisin-like domain-containing protein [Paraburkholderia sp. D15]|uniref:phage tail sheath family protein n=1 Tax=Paraburkholderia sp. D15 TaxID=2880218 RepID=UPI00247A4310|nr:phage tail sheath C-terminal domain-containing protein [Paraburkholderia sp. D15]WGS53961.1 phage tail sheath subtilisin-like domain-containing protein [Paraburkholderia sp. D15]